jgi:hypothetical protein
MEVADEIKLEELLMVKLGELMYKRDHCFDYFEKRLFIQCINGIHLLLQVEYSHQPLESYESKVPEILVHHPVVRPGDEKQ